MVNVNYTSSSSGFIGGAPVRPTTYGQYNYYTRPQTLGRPIGNPQGGAAGGGSSTTQTGNPAAEQFLTGVLGGTNLPFSPFQKSQMLSRQSDMSAAAEGARNQRLNEAGAMGGASANDPSMNAARMSNMAARQTQNQTAARDIDVQANQANFGAQMDAAGILNANAMQRAQWAQSAAQGAGVGMPFSPWGSGMGGGGGGGQSRPSQTVGLGLFGHSAYTNPNDLWGGGATGYRQPWQQNKPTQQRPAHTPGTDPSDYTNLR